MTDHLCARLPPTIPRHCIRPYIRPRSAHDKYQAIKGMENGSIRILICTEANGMGCDVRGIRRVIQYGYDIRYSDSAASFNTVWQLLMPSYQECSGFIHLSSD
jgi:hypothetical protein